MEPPKLGESGSALWNAVYSERLPALHRQLLVEACRIADRLDRLDGELDGGSWLATVYNDDGTEVTVTVDKPLAEARQQATALRGLVAEIQKAVPKSKPAAPRSEGGGGVVTDLLSRIDRGA